MEDRTPFDAIKSQFGISEGEVIKIMRREMKASSFRMWRERVQGRNTKHNMKSLAEVDRFKCSAKSILHLIKLAKDKYILSTKL